jgi:hypothetical protein
MPVPQDSGSSFSNAREVAPGATVLFPKLFTVYVDPANGQPVLQFEDQCPDPLRAMLRMAMGGTRPSV